MSNLFKEVDDAASLCGSDKCPVTISSPKWIRSSLCPGSMFEDDLRFQFCQIQKCR